MLSFGGVWVRVVVIGAWWRWLQLHAPADLPSEEEPLVTHSRGACLDNRKVLYPCRELNPDPSVGKLLPINYTDWLLYQIFVACVSS